VEQVGTSCTGTCACRGNWTGSDCAKCGLNCRNGGMPNADCSECTGCAAGSYGSRCERNYFILAFRFNTNVSSWYGQTSGDAVNAGKRWTATLAGDLQRAVRSVVPWVVTRIEVEEVKPDYSNRLVAAVAVRVRLSVEDEAGPSAPSRRRLLAAASSSTLLEVYTRFLPLLGDTNSLAFQGAITSNYDPAWAVQASDPSGTQALTSPPPPQDCFTNVCDFSGNSQPSNGGGSSFIDTIKNSTLYLALFIAACVLVLILLVVGTVFAVRRCRDSGNSNDALKRLGGTTSTGGTELIISNPAVSANWNRI